MIIVFTLYTRKQRHRNTKELQFLEELNSVQALKIYFLLGMEEKAILKSSHFQPGGCCFHHRGEGLGFYMSVLMKLLFQALFSFHSACSSVISTLIHSHEINYHLIARDCMFLSLYYRDPDLYFPLPAGCLLLGCTTSMSK